MTKPTDNQRNAPAASRKMGVPWFWIVSFILFLSPVVSLADAGDVENEAVQQQLPVVPENFSPIFIEISSPALPDPDEHPAINFANCAGFLDAVITSGRVIEVGSVSPELFMEVARRKHEPMDEIALLNARQAARKAGLESMAEMPDCSCHLHFFLACQRLYTQNDGSELPSP
jgi:hypothetical protein